MRTFFTNCWLMVEAPRLEVPRTLSTRAFTVAPRLTPPWV